MWHWLTDHLPYILTPTAIAAVLAFLRVFRPRRLIVWLGAAVETETWMAEATYEKASGLRWMQKAQECQAEVARLDTEIVRLRTLIAKQDGFGGGSTSSGSNCSVTQKTTQ